MREYIVTETLFPERVKKRKPIDEIYELPYKTQGIYGEVIVSYNHNIPILTAIGLRAVVESVCLEIGVNKNNLKEKINDLVGLRYLTSQQVEYLHTQRFMGNAAAHEIVRPNQKEIDASLDIIETLLRTIYILPNVAKNIKTGINP